MKRLLGLSFLVLACALSANAQALWSLPGQSGNGVGFANSPYWTGSFSTTPCGSISSGSSWTAPVVIQNCTYTGSSENMNCNYCEFLNVDFKVTNNTQAAGTHMLFFGCRFQSNCVGCTNTGVTGSDLYFFYDSWTPLASLHTSPPGYTWPSAGAGTNANTIIDGTNAIPFADSYQFGLNITGTSGPIYIDHGEVWGYGDAITLPTGSTNTIVLTNTQMHSPSDPNGNVYHQDGPGYSNEAAGPSNIYFIGNVAAMLGNTNSLAMQGVTSAYNNLRIDFNFWSGDNATIAMCHGAPGCTNSTHYGNIFGTDVLDAGITDNGNVLASGSVWACNTIYFRPGTTWTNNDGWHPTSGMNGQYIWPTSSTNHATDNGSNTTCAIPGPPSLQFGNQGVSSTSASQTVTLYNTGSSTLTISMIALATGTQFSIASNACGSSLGAGSNCVITLNFAPTSRGPQVDTLKITDSSSGTSSPQLVPIFGVGTAGGPTVATPTFSPAAGGYATTQTVSLSDSTPSAAICYTLNGSNPTAATAGTCDSNGGVEFTYTTGLTVSSTKTIKAIGTLSGDANSSVASGTFTINGAIATPTLSPTGGTFSSTQNVTLSDSVGGATLCFTTDGSTPTGNGAGVCTHGSTYSATVAVAVSLTIKAIASESGYLDSSVASGVFVINSVLPNAGAAGAFMGQ